MFSMAAFAHSYSSNGVLIWSAIGRCRLARAAILFTVPPSPSLGASPCEVAKKCHSTETLKSPSWFSKFETLNVFLYWAIEHKSRRNSFFALHFARFQGISPLEGRFQRQGRGGGTATHHCRDIQRAYSRGSTNQVCHTPLKRKVIIQNLSQN